jgi:hypothetical protein
MKDSGFPFDSASDWIAPASPEDPGVFAQFSSRFVGQGQERRSSCRCRLLSIKGAAKTLCESWAFRNLFPLLFLKYPTSYPWGNSLERTDVRQPGQKTRRSEPACRAIPDRVGVSVSNGKIQFSAEKKRARSSRGKLNTISSWAFV